MQKQEIKEGNRVMWDNDPDDSGIVTNVSDSAIFILWDNGNSGWVDVRDLENISLLVKEKGGD